MKLFFAMALAALAALNIEAQNYQYFATGGTVFGSTNSYAVVSGASYNNGTPVVTYVNASSDLAGSAIQFWSVTNWVDCTATNSNTTLYASTNTALVSPPTNTVVLVRHMQGDTYEKLLVVSTANTNQITVTSAPVQAVLPGDRIYLVAQAGKIPCGAATVSAGPAQAVYVGQKGYPLFVDIKGTNSCNINALSATYQ